MTERLPGRLLRGFSGVLCAGLVALFAVLVGGWVFTTRTGAPGPGPGMLLGHGLAAAAAIAAQLVADRRAGRVGVIAAWVVVALAVVVLGGYWLF